MRKIILAILTTGFLIGLIALWQAFEFLGSGAEVAPGRDLVFEVLPGEGFYRVAERLQGEGLLTSAQNFKILAKLSGHAERLRVGEYAVNTSKRPMELLEILSSGHSIEHQVTFPEGWNSFEFANHLEEKGVGKKQDFLRLIRDQKLITELLGESLPSLEGYLYPETYKYTKYTSLESLVRGMVQNFLQAYQSVSNPNLANLSRHQIVILASVIEKETGAPEERPLISSVFHNRLAKGMRLQSDPTILYGLMIETGEMKKNISREDIVHPTPYNTYTVPALPVGPISNPGKDSLVAAASPAHSSFYYFVSKNEGTHTFSENLEQHNSAVQKFQVNVRARAGKSWRDLKGTHLSEKAKNAQKRAPK